MWEGSKCIFFFVGGRGIKTKIFWNVRRKHRKTRIFPLLCRLPTSTGICTPGRSSGIRISSPSPAQASTPDPGAISMGWCPVSSLSRKTGRHGIVFPTQASNKVLLRVPHECSNPLIPQEWNGYWSLGMGNKLPDGRGKVHPAHGWRRIYKYFQPGWKKFC